MKAAWVIADVDDDIVIPDAPAGNVIQRTTVSGTGANASTRITTSAETYNTISKAVENAALLRLSADQADGAKLMVQIDTNAYSAEYQIYATPEDTEGAVAGDITNNFQDTNGGWDSGVKYVGPFDATNGEKLGQNNVVVLRFHTDSQTDYVYAAYQVVVE